MKDIEIILIDDCSKDDSISIIEKYMKEDPRIKLIKNRNAISVKITPQPNQLPPQN